MPCGSPSITLACRTSTSVFSPALCAGRWVLRRGFPVPGGVVVDKKHDDAAEKLADLQERNEESDKKHEKAAKKLADLEEHTDGRLDELEGRLGYETADREEKMNGALATEKHSSEARFDEIEKKIDELEGGHHNLHHHGSNIGPRAMHQVMLQAQSARSMTKQRGAAPQKEIGDVTYREGLGENFPYAGIGLLGSGYDMINGNPDGDSASMVDPGFRTPILELVYDQTMGLSRDVRLLTPGGTFMMDENACFKAEQASDVSSSKGYHASLQKDAAQKASASASGAFGGLALNAKYSFAASQKMTEETEREQTQNVVKFEIKSFCMVYHVGFSTPDYMMRDLSDKKMQGMQHITNEKVKIPYTLEFDDVVRSIAEDETDETAWFRLFNTYGTHMVDEIHLGGKIRHVSETSRTAYTEMKKQGRDVKSEMEGSFGASYGGYKGSAMAGFSSGNNNAKNSKNSIDVSKTKITTSVRGGFPPEEGVESDEGWAQWAQTLKDDPMPVKYNLVALTDVHPVLGGMRDTYKEMYESYAKEAIGEAHDVEPPDFKEIGDITYVDAIESGVYIRDKNGEVWKQTNPELGLWEVAANFEHRLQTFKLTPQGDFGIGTDNERNTWRYAGGTWTMASSTKTNFVAIQPTDTAPLLYGSNMKYQAVRLKRGAWRTDPINKGDNGRKNAAKSDPKCTGYFRGEYWGKPGSTGAGHYSDSDVAGKCDQTTRKTNGGGTCEICGWNGASCKYGARNNNGCNYAPLQHKTEWSGSYGTYLVCTVKPIAFAALFMSSRKRDHAMYVVFKDGEVVRKENGGATDDHPDVVDFTPPGGRDYTTDGQVKSIATSPRGEHLYAVMKDGKVWYRFAGAFKLKSTAGECNHHNGGKIETKHGGKVSLPQCMKACSESKMCKGIDFGFRKDGTGPLGTCSDINKVRCDCYLNDSCKSVVKKNTFSAYTKTPKAAAGYADGAWHEIKHMGQISHISVPSDDEDFGGAWTVSTAHVLKKIVKNNKGKLVWKNQETKQTTRASSSLPML